MLRANSRTLPIEDIKIPEAFAQTTPGRNKVEMRKAFYKVAGKFDKEIIVDRKGYLFDGYSAYIAAKELGLDKVPVVQIVPFKKKADEPTNKYEGMSNKELDLEMCEKKGACTANNSSHRKNDCPLIGMESCDITNANRAEVIKYLLAEDAEAATKPQDKQEPIKLYCVKDFKPGEFLTKGKVYEIAHDGAKITYDDGWAASLIIASDNFRGEKIVPNYLVPLVKRPAKVGESFLIVAKNELHIPQVEIGNIFVAAKKGAHFGGKYVDTANGNRFYDQKLEYLVLDGYHPEPEPEAEKEPEFYSGKVVCVKADGYFTVGKVYEFCNGLVKSNTGDSYNKGEPIESFGDLSDGTWVPKFIEFKGEADD